MRVYRLTEEQLVKLAEDAAEIAILRNAALNREVIHDELHKMLHERLAWLDKKMDEEKLGRMVRRGLGAALKLFTGLGGGK